MTGTRAYAVRDDLRTYNQRLLDYVKNGGNLIVLYNTPGVRSRPVRAVSRRAAAARRRSVGGGLAGRDPRARRARCSTTPNKITKADFEGWVEQRGSKFFSEWDKAYTPMIAT